MYQVVPCRTVTLKLPYQVCIKPWVLHMPVGTAAQYGMACPILTFTSECHSLALSYSHWSVLYSLAQLGQLLVLALIRTSRCGGSTWHGVHHVLVLIHASRFYRRAHPGPTLDPAHTYASGYCSLPQIGLSPIPALTLSSRRCKPAGEFSKLGGFTFLVKVLETTS